MEIALLLGLAFMAGLIDAVVGGGGLVQIPALFGFLPNSSPALVFGTNKFASIAGTTVAAARYARSVPIHWEATLPAAVSAFGFSFLGARAVSALSTEIVRPLVLALLVVAAIFTYVRKDFGTIHAPRHEGLKEKFYAVGLGGAIGFYDGFFGPGTGSFLIFLFIRFFGFGFLAASAAAKVVNVATNLAALAYFGFSDSILYQLALPMAMCNGLGAVAGARLAISRGSGFVRSVFLLVVLVLIAKFSYDTFR